MVTTNEVNSAVVSPAKARGMVRKHRGIVEVEVGLVHDMFKVRVSKSEANRLLDAAESGEFNIHAMEVRNELILIVVESPVDDDE